MYSKPELTCPPWNGRLTRRLRAPHSLLKALAGSLSLSPRPVLHPQRESQMLSAPLKSLAIDGFHDLQLHPSVLPLLALVVLLGLWISLRLPCKSRDKHGLQLPRLPTTLPLLGDTLHSAWLHRHDLLDWMADQAQQFDGQPFVWYLVGQPEIIVVSTPQGFEDVLKTHFERFPKGDEHLDNLNDLLGDGIFASDGKTWTHQRKTVSHLFTMRALREGMTASVQEHTKLLLQILEHYANHPTTKQLDLFRLLNLFTMETFAEIGFGVQLGCLDPSHPEQQHESKFQQAFDGVQRQVFHRYVEPRWLWKIKRLLGIGREGQLQQHLKGVNDTVYQIISESLARRARHEKLGPHDVVSLFLDSAPDDKQFDPKFLRDIVVNFLMAGRDTTAQALSWFFYHISQHPEVLQRIRAELNDTFPDFASRKEPLSMEEADQLVYLEATVRETLRLNPSVHVTQGSSVRRDAFGRHASGKRKSSGAWFLCDGTNDPCVGSGRQTVSSRTVFGRTNGQIEVFVVLQVCDL